MSNGPENPVTSSENVAVTRIGESFVGSVTSELRTTEGGTVSIVKLETAKAKLAFPLESVTVIVQLLWGPSDKELKVVVLGPTTATAVADEQSPP